MNSNKRSESLIRKKLLLLKEVSARDPQREVHGRDAFLQDACNVVSNASGLAAKRKLNQNSKTATTNVPVRHPQPYPRGLRVALPVIMVLLIVLGTSWATVEASLGSQPDQFLYPVKLGSEDVALSLTLDHERQFILSTDYVQNRASEIILTLNNRKAPSAQVIARYKTQVQRSLSLAAGLPDDEAVDAIQKLQTRLEIQLSAFDLVNTNISPLADNTRKILTEYLNDEIEVTQKGIANLTWLREKVREEKHHGNAAAGTASSGSSFTGSQATDEESVTLGKPNLDAGDADLDVSCTSVNSDSMINTPTSCDGNLYDKTRTHTPPGFLRKTPTETPTPTNNFGK